MSFTAHLQNTKALYCKDKGAIKSFFLINFILKGNCHVADSQSAQPEAFVVSGYYQLAREWNGVLPKLPDDPPARPDMLTLIGKNGHNTQYVILSARTVIIVHERTSTDCRAGFMYAGDYRQKAAYVLGGGKVQSDYDAEGSDRKGANAQNASV